MQDLREAHLFVGRLRREHLRLEKTLEEIEQRLADECADPPAWELRDELARLRSDLARHFQEETSGGCLEHAACRTPHLARQVTELERQHDRLLALLDELMEGPAGSGWPQSGDEFRLDFAEFASRIREHDEKEHRLLSESCGLDYREA